MTEPVIVYRFTPQFAGAFLLHVPQRDLTQADVDNMTGLEQRDAFSPHPAYGTPLYTAVKAADVPDFSRVHEGLNLEPTPETEAEPDLPKWFLAKRAKLAERGIVIPSMEPGESKKAFEARVDEDGVATLTVAAENAAVNPLGIQLPVQDGDSVPDQDGDE